MSRQPTIDTNSVAQDQIRAFVERILRMKEEAKAINDDIREIYAEAKGNGFDKTVLGQVVRHIEKRAKDPDTLAEQGALFELYMGAIDGVPYREVKSGTAIATHVHDEPASTVAADPAESQPLGKAGEADRAVSPAPIHPQPASLAGLSEATASGAPIQPSPTADVEDATDGQSKSSSHGEGAPVALPTSNSETTNGGSDDSHPRPDLEAVNLDRRPNQNDDIELKDTHHDVGASSRPVTASEEPGRSLASEAPSNVVPIKKQWKQSDPAHRDCLNPEQCGGFSNLGLCPKCKEAPVGVHIPHMGPVRV